LSVTSGKKLENNWRDSIPPNIFFYRFRDGTSSWGGGQENTRFQQVNMCDCMMFDGEKLYLLELKSHKGKSIPFSAIRQNQLDELSKASTYKNIIAGFVIHFADVGTTYFCKADDVLYFIKHEERRSIPISWCEQWGTKIDGKLKKINYLWDIKSFVEQKPIEVVPAIPKWHSEQTDW